MYNVKAIVSIEAYKKIEVTNPKYYFIREKIWEEMTPEDKEISAPYVEIEYINGKSEVFKFDTYEKAINYRDRLIKLNNITPVKYK